MNGYTTIFKVIGEHRTKGQIAFVRCFKSLIGAQSDIDRRIKDVGITLGWTLIADLWRNEDEDSRVHCYRLVKLRTLCDEEIWYRIEADNLYA